MNLLNYNYGANLQSIYALISTLKLNLCHIRIYPLCLPIRDNHECGANCLVYTDVPHNVGLVLNLQLQRVWIWYYLLRKVKQ